VYITFNSRVFPEITLVGHFNPEGINTTESADDPNQLVYTAPFTVETSFPYFGNPAALAETFRNATPPSTRREGEAEVIQRNQQRRESSFP
jgi:hypothetical protein